MQLPKTDEWVLELRKHLAKNTQLSKKMSLHKNHGLEALAKQSTMTL